MKTTIIMVRHGQSVGNKNLIYCGTTDVELTELGKKQAKMTADYLLKYKIDAVYSSPLKRAKYTAIQYDKLTGKGFTVVDNLREMNGGEWEGVPLMEIAEKDSEMMDIWLNDFGRTDFRGGESAERFTERIVDAVTKIAEENKGKTVLLTVHATPIKSITAVALGIPVIDMKKVHWARNSSINIFSYEDGKFTVDKTDIVEHLGEFTNPVGDEETRKLQKPGTSSKTR